MVAIDFVVITADSCVHMCQADDVIVVLWVDDFYITGPNDIIMDKMVEELRRRFDVNDLGPFLNIHFEYDELHESISMDQNHYIDTLNAKHG
jgi:hypothetical protein